MTDSKIHLLPPRNVRSRLAILGLALIMASPLLMRPQLWQYLMAVILVHDVLLRLIETKQQESHTESILDLQEETPV